MIILTKIKEGIKSDISLVPKTIAILYIAFLGLFAFDVFTPDVSFMQAIGAFLVHLVPNYFLILLLFIAWKNELWGGIFFIEAFLLFFVIFRNSFFINIAMFGPLLLIGVLFLLNSYLKEKGTIK